MEYDKKLPQDYMTVGEMAKKMGVTVRTLQYYDQQGLLSPSAESEGGRRLYTDRDMILLHQILSLKHLGFSLDAIKNLSLIHISQPLQMLAPSTGLFPGATGFLQVRIRPADIHQSPHGPDKPGVPPTAAAL